MFDDALRIHEFSLGLLNRMIADLSDAELARPLGPGHHSGMWVLGHLVIGTDYVAMLLGEKVEISPERTAAFGPGSKDDAPVPAGVTRQSLLAELKAGHARAVAAAAKADPAALAKPHAISFFEGTPLKSVSDVVQHLLTSHVGFHIGQMSVYRRASGKPMMF